MGDYQSDMRSALVGAFDSQFKRPLRDAFDNEVPETVEVRDGVEWGVRRGMIGLSAHRQVRSLCGAEVVIRRTLNTPPQDSKYEADFNTKPDNSRVLPFRRFVCTPDGDIGVTHTNEHTEPGATQYVAVGRAIGAVIIIPEISTLDPGSEAA